VVIGLAELADPEVRAVAQLAALGLLWDAVRRDLAPVKSRLGWPLCAQWAFARRCRFL
jgi:hypothetical protein